MMMYRLLSALLVLLGLASGVGCFHVERKEICPGSTFFFELPYSIISKNMNLFFYKNGVERNVANSMQSIDPQYPFKGNRPIIPEVMKKHEGEYYWKMTNVRSKVDHIMLVLKDCSTNVKLKYGEELSLRVPTAASVLEFNPTDSNRRFVLWSRINAANEKGSRGTYKYGSWKARTITQADQGRYVFLRESGGQISSTKVAVEEKSQDAHVNDEDIKDYWQVQVDIPAHEVQVIYFPHAGDEVTLFQNGVETDEGFKMFGDRIKLRVWSGLTGFRITRVQPSDAGRYNIYDKKGLLAMTMFLDRDSEFNPKSLVMPLGISAGVIAGLVCCCWCCCKCCSDSDKDESTAASPDEELPVHVHDMVVLSGSGDPLQPSSSMRDLPYITVIQDEVPGEGGGGRGGEGGDDDGVAPSAPTPPPAYPAVQHPPMAWSSGLGDVLSYSPLSMDASGATAAAAADNSTYTSDKLNF